MRKGEYSAYLESPLWREKRKQVFRRSGGICERCERQRGQHVHHVSYEHVGDEPLCDLLLLCGACHRFVHGLAAHDPARVPTFDELARLIDDL